MRRTRLESLILQNVLESVNSPHAALDYKFDGDSSNPHIRNVCARVHHTLADQIAVICDQLQISKRLFIESALVEAVDKALQIMEEEGFYSDGCYDRDEKPQGGE